MIKRLIALKASHPLSVRILVSILLASSLFAAAVAGIQLYSMFRSEQAEINARLKDAESTFLLSVQDALWRLDNNLIQSNIDAIAQLPYIAHVRLTTSENEVFQSGDTPQHGHVQPQRYLLEQTTAAGEIDLGTLTLLVDLSSAYNNLKRNALLIIALQGVKTFVVSALILLILHRLLFRHLLRLKQSAARLTPEQREQAFDYDRPEHQQGDELDEIRDALNQMHHRFISNADYLRRIKADKRRLSLAAENSTSALLIFNSAGETLYSNPLVESQLGLTDSTPGLTLIEFFARVEPELSFGAILEKIRQPEGWKKELFWLENDGDPIWMLVRGLRFEDKGEELFVLNAIDITEQRNARERERHLLEHDSLTGLPNRKLGLQEIDKQLAEAFARDSGVAVFTIAIRSYAAVLEFLGIQYVDLLMLETIRNCRAHLPTTAYLARCADDLLLCAVPLDACPGGSVRQVVESLLTHSRQPIRLHEEQIDANLQVGITVAPSDGDQATQLLQQALSALHRAEQSNLSYRFFRPEMRQSAERRLRIAAMLKSGQILDELQVYYQPIVGTELGTLLGCEALARWHNAELGWVTPDEFIGEAERLNVIGELGELILQRACLQVAQWRSQGYDISVSVNVSPIQVRDLHFTRAVDNALSISGLPASSLKLEVTEQLILSGTDLTLEKLQQLSDRGIALVIDDFGSGYASMNYLCGYPFKYLKIDKSFILAMVDDTRTQTLVAAILSLAHTLGLNVVAEGVESAEHLALLKEMKCELLQGYYFSKALPPETFTELLVQNRPLPCDLSP